MILSTSALIFAVNILTSGIKKYVYPAFGATGVHVIAFIIATVGAFYTIYGGQYPGFIKLVGAAGMVFSTAVAFYEVVLKNISFFQPQTPVVVDSNLG